MLIICFIHQLKFSVLYPNRVFHHCDFVHSRDAVWQTNLLEHPKRKEDEESKLFLNYIII